MLLDLRLALVRSRVPYPLQPYYRNSTETHSLETQYPIYGGQSLFARGYSFDLHKMLAGRRAAVRMEPYEEFPAAIVVRC
jgi:hypothetical protein